MVHGTNADEVHEDEEGLYTMRVLGGNMAFMLKCIKAGFENGIELPERETPKFTNFVR